jgi:hypothetical protein
MSAMWIAVVAIIGMAIGIVKATIGQMLQEEISTRLGRIPFLLIRLASLRVPPELRDDLAAEWNAELEFIVTETDGVPVTRLIRGIRVSTGFLLSARKIANGLASGRTARVSFESLVAIGLIIGIGTAIIMGKYPGLTPQQALKARQAARAGHAWSAGQLHLLPGGSASLILLGACMMCFVLAALLGGRHAELCAHCCAWLFFAAGIAAYLHGYRFPYLVMLTYAPGSLGAILTKLLAGLIARHYSTTHFRHEITAAETHQ